MGKDIINYRPLLPSFRTLPRNVDTETLVVMIDENCLWKILFGTDWFDLQKCWNVSACLPYTGDSHLLTVTTARKFSQIFAFHSLLPLSVMSILRLTFWATANSSNSTPTCIAAGMTCLRNNDLLFYCFPKNIKHRFAFYSVF